MGCLSKKTDLLLWLLLHKWVHASWKHLAVLSILTPSENFKHESLHYFVQTNCCIWSSFCIA